MERDRFVQSIGLGAAAGLIGTGAMEAAKTRRQRSAPDPIDDPADFDEATNIGSSQIQENSTLKSLTSGSSIAAVYAALHQEPKILRNGLLIGLSIWTIAKIGWLPAAHVEREAATSAGKTALEIAQHVLFGIAIAGAYQSLRGDREVGA